MKETLEDAGYMVTVEEDGKQVPQMQNNDVYCVFSISDGEHPDV